MELREYKTLWVGIVSLALITLLLSACGSEPAAKSTVSTRTPSPTADELATLIALQQRATEVPSVTPWPTSTSTPTDTPTHTPTTVPTHTPTHTPTSTPTTASSSTTASAPTVFVFSTLTDTSTATATVTTTATATATATVTATETVTVTPSATNTLTTPTPYPVNSPRSTQVTLQPVSPTAVSGAAFDASGELQDHYWLARPFPRDPNNKVRDFASRNYAYGTTAGGQFQTHHGLDFQNLQGTAVLAVASGWVVYAGDDINVMFGPKNNFYGYLVVIEHDMPAPNGEPLYTLYGHLFRVTVETGQRVELQQKVGLVGSTGVALGAHLHLEVRIGDPYDYGRTYNPDLWLRPWANYGTLAGRVFDRNDQRAYDLNITIQPVNGLARSTYSYADDTVNPDLYYGEHYTYGDLPAGEYQVSVRIRGVLRFKDTVTVEAGQTTWFDIHYN